MELKLIPIEKPEEINFIFGQTHFIKSVEDIHEALVNSVPGIQFGIAFCEASSKRLVRWSGTNDEMIHLARLNALNVGAGHSFFIFLASGFYPINILNAVKAVPEVCQIYCATANNTRVVVAKEDDQVAVLGVMDGETPLGIEGEEDIAWRKGFLRQVGYKL